MLVPKRFEPSRVNSEWDSVQRIEMCADILANLYEQSPRNGNMSSGDVRILLADLDRCIAILVSNPGFLNNNLNRVLINDVR